MSSSQHSTAPAAGKTKLFQMAARWRPIRQATNQAQASVANKANAKAGAENSGKKPGAKRATLAAGWAGKPVCMATQITQIVSAHTLKNNRVNQSIKAPKLRRRVGSAKAANAEMPGKAKSKVRSDMPVSQVPPKVTSTNHKGKAKWGYRQHCKS
jgi:hypothetical protein